MNYCLKKLDFTHEEFEKIMALPVKSFYDYKSYYSVVKKLRYPILWGNKLGIIPDTVYKKFFMFDSSNRNG